MSWSHISNSFFLDNGKNYSFIAAMYSTESIDFDAVDKEGKFNDKFDCELDMKFVKEFEYSTSFNLLVINGSLTYEDLTGKCMNFINNPYEKIAVMMHEAITPSDGLITTKDITAKIILTFIINKVIIINRLLNSVTYKFELISTNYLNLASIVNFSNYNNKKLDIFSIIKTCFTLSKVVFDKYSFNNVTTNVSLNYTTNVNDNCISIVKYLFNKLYFYSNNLDDSIKYIYYDELSNTIKIFDLKDEKTYGKHRMCMLDIGSKSSLENLLGSEYIKISSVNRMSTTDVFGDLMNLKRYSYSYDSNKLLTNDITNKLNINYVNNFPKESSRFEEGKYSEFPNSVLNYLICDSEWNASRDLYNRFSSNVIGHNSLVLNMSGLIDFKPSYCIDLGFPVNESDLKDGSDSKKKYEQYLKLYSDINGIWIASKVHHIIEPAKHKYKLNVIVFRNTKNKDNNYLNNNLKASLVIIR